MYTDDLARDRQPQTGPFPGRLGGKEVLENMIDGILADASPVVSEQQLHFPPALRETRTDPDMTGPLELTALEGVDAVQQEVDHHLLEGGEAAPHGGKAGSQLEMQL